MDSDESALRIDVRQRLAWGDLPAQRADTMWGGRGEGLPCDCCHGILSPTDIMYELEYKSTARTLRMHLQCYQLWQQEAAGLLRCRPEPGGARSSDAHPTRD